ncbi:MAG: methionyl-tRNA formyltransferase [Bacteroidetes bacterium]|nr:methionyl-tRNA formyltransferase [Bacteroidota bacterium]
MRIVFFGTPEFASHSLEHLIKAGKNIVAVVTAPDKPAGRGMNLQQSAVKQVALKYAIPVLQPEKLKNPEFLNQLKSYQAELQLVIAFRMLPEVVWNMPPLGTMNLHASLLPDYRGAAPINWAIINGEKVTGVSTFFLKHEIDTGDILLRKEFQIGDEMDAGELHDCLMELGAEAILESVEMIEKGQTKGEPQGDESRKIAPKIFKETCQIDFSKSAIEVYNFIRGMSPYPAAWFLFHGKPMKVLKAKLVNFENQLNAGDIQIESGNRILVKCKDQCIELLEIQPESKKRMKTEDFLRGWRP